MGRDMVDDGVVFGTAPGGEGGGVRGKAEGSWGSRRLRLTERVECVEVGRFEDVDGERRISALLYASQVIMRSRRRSKRKMQQEKEAMGWSWQGLRPRGGDARQGLAIARLRRQPPQSKLPELRMPAEGEGEIAEKGRRRATAEPRALTYAHVLKL